ncbi:MAG: zinc-binding dehydrogenase [Pseudomonadota bacterium]
MRALQLHGDRDLRLDDIDPPPPPAAGEVTVDIKVVALNHIDVWGWRGMAFAKRKLPLVVGAEAMGVVRAVGEGVTSRKPGDRVTFFGAKTCGVCRACLEGRDNLCENVGGVMGFHLDGFCRESLNIEERFTIPIPDGVSDVHAACAPITFGTPVHMLYDNAKLEADEWILIQAGGSGVGSSAIKLAKDTGATVIATVGDDEKAEKARTIGADHVINYRKDRFEGVVRKITKKRGVDVVFEHTGPDTWAGSMFSLKPGGRLVTCGSTTGITAQINLFQLYQQQLRLIGSFGCTIGNIHTALEKMASGVTPVIDTEVTLDTLSEGLDRLESRQVFGKIVVRL